MLFYYTYFRQNITTATIQAKAMVRVICLQWRFTPHRCQLFIFGAPHFYFITIRNIYKTINECKENYLLVLTIFIYISLLKQNEFWLFLTTSSSLMPQEDMKWKVGYSMQTFLTLLLQNIFLRPWFYTFRDVNRFFWLVLYFREWAWVRVVCVNINIRKFITGNLRQSCISPIAEKQRNSA